MGMNTINNLVKTLIKKIKKYYIPKSEIISITGHNIEAGLDAYDSGDEQQQQAISFAIDSHFHKKEKSQFFFISNL